MHSPPIPSSAKEYLQRGLEALKAFDRANARIAETLAFFQLPLRIISEANARGHWTGAARRAREQRGATALVVRAGLKWPRPLDGHFAITLQRLGARRLDGDNLQRALKAVRDGVADALEIDDGDDRLQFSYDQDKGPYQVRILIERVAAPTIATKRKKPSRKA